MDARELFLGLHMNGIRISRGDVRALMAEHDIDDSGHIDFEEFVAMCGLEE